MMTYQQYLLTKLAEEATEVAKIALKTQQFGMDETRDGYPSNRERLHSELNDFLSHVTMLNEECDLGFYPDIEAMEAKKVKTEKYAQFSRELGMLEKKKAS